MTSFLLVYNWNCVWYFRENHCCTFFFPQNLCCAFDVAVFLRFFWLFVFFLIEENGYDIALWSHQFLSVFWILRSSRHFVVLVFTCWKKCPIFSSQSCTHFWFHLVLYLREMTWKCLMNPSMQISYGLPAWIGPTGKNCSPEWYVAIIICICSET